MDERQVLISGIPETVTEERLKYYFGSSRRGGPIETITLQTENNSAIITFKDKESLLKVIQTKTFNLGSKEIFASVYEEEKHSHIKSPSLIEPEKELHDDSEPQNNTSKYKVFIATDESVKPERLKFFLKNKQKTGVSVQNMTSVDGGFTLELPNLNDTNMLAELKIEDKELFVTPCCSGTWIRVTDMDDEVTNQRLEFFLSNKHKVKRQLTVKLLKRVDSGTCIILLKNSEESEYVASLKTLTVRNCAITINRYCPVCQKVTNSNESVVQGAENISINKNEENRCSTAPPPPPGPPPDLCDKSDNNTAGVPPPPPLPPPMCDKITPKSSNDTNGCNDVKNTSGMVPPPPPPPLPPLVSDLVTAQGSDKETPGSTSDHEAPKIDKSSLSTCLLSSIKAHGGAAALNKTIQKERPVDNISSLLASIKSHGGKTALKKAEQKEFTPPIDDRSNLLASIKAHGGAGALRKAEKEHEKPVDDRDNLLSAIRAHGGRAKLKTTDETEHEKPVDDRNNLLAAIRMHGGRATLKKADETVKRNIKNENSEEDILKRKITKRRSQIKGKDNNETASPLDRLKSMEFPRQSASGNNDEDSDGSENNEDDENDWNS